MEIVEPQTTTGVIKSKRTLHSRIKECIDDLQSIDFKFPFEIKFQETMSSPVFKIKIDKEESNFFVDEKGQKWVKADE